MALGGSKALRAWVTGEGQTEDPCHSRVARGLECGSISRHGTAPHYNSYTPSILGSFTLYRITTPATASTFRTPHHIYDAPCCETPFFDDFCHAPTALTRLISLFAHPGVKPPRLRPKKSTTYSTPYSTPRYPHFTICRECPPCCSQIPRRRLPPARHLPWFSTPRSIHG